MEFPARTASPAAARQFIATALAELCNADPHGEFVGAARTVVSELVTNSINAGTDAVGVSVFRTSTGVRIEVDDTAPGEPVAQTPSAESTSGRGLLLVSLLSTDWGWAPGPDGKRVWADIQLDSGGLGDPDPEPH